jgi:hypothetical protein
MLGCDRQVESHDWSHRSSEKMYTEIFGVIVTNKMVDELEVGRGPYDLEESGSDQQAFRPPERGLDAPAARFVMKGLKTSIPPRYSQRLILADREVDCVLGVEMNWLKTSG